MVESVAGAGVKIMRKDPLTEEPIMHRFIKTKESSEATTLRNDKIWK